VASDGPLQFERMEHLDERSNDEPKPVASIWRELSDESDEVKEQEQKHKEEEEEDELPTLIDVCEGNREQLCLRYRNCLERVSHELLAGVGGGVDGGDGTAEDPLNQQKVPGMHTFDEDDVKLAFAVGAATGICMVIFIISFALCVKSGCELRKKRQQTTTDGDSCE